MTTKRAALCGMAAPILFGFLTMVATLLQTDFMEKLGWDVYPSGLALGPYGWIQVANFVLEGILIIAFGLGLYWAMGSKIGEVAASLVILAGVGGLLLSWKTDPPQSASDDPRTDPLRRLPPPSSLTPCFLLSDRLRFTRGSGVLRLQALLPRRSWPGHPWVCRSASATLGKLHVQHGCARSARGDGDRTLESITRDLTVWSASDWQSAARPPGEVAAKWSEPLVRGCPFTGLR